MNKIHSRFFATAALAALLSAGTLGAAEEKASASLKVGDPAPPLAADKWVKGEPVKELEKGKVHVLEFWATWCGPCVSAIPHVTELQKKYADKDLIVIGMNVWENDVSAVEPFVKKMGDKMDYRVATDVGGRNDGKMATTWMKAAGRNGIPCSFIVDREGKIAWIGHPMQMDRPLAAVIEGKFDPAAEAKTQEKLQGAQKQFREAMQTKDYDKAIMVIDEVIAADPSSAKMYKPAKLMALYGKKDFKAGNALAKELGEENAKEPGTLAQLAMMMAEQGDAKDVDLDLAQSLAEKVVAAGGDTAWIGNVAVAKVNAARGDFAKAVEAQTKALEGAEGRQKEFVQTQLDEYKKKAEKADKAVK